MQEVFEKIIEKLEGKLKELEKVSNFKLSQKQKAQNYGYFVAIDHAIGIVEEVAGEYNNGWIPVEEGLPKVEDLKSIEDCKSYMIQRRCGIIDVAHYIKVYGEPYFSSHALEVTDVIAWQPLPEPYRPKEE